jgi:hypothetical protein
MLSYLYLVGEKLQKILKQGKGKSGEQNFLRTRLTKTIYPQNSHRQPQLLEPLIKAANQTPLLAV